MRAEDRYDVDELEQPNPKGHDALSLLKSEHEWIDSLFTRFERSTDQAEARMRFNLARQIRDAIAVHAQLKDEIFYPAMRRVRGAEPLVKQAERAHDQADGLIRKLDQVADSTELARTMVTLAKVVRAHLHDEELTLFELARAARIDLHEIGHRLAQRKAELVDQVAA